MRHYAGLSEILSVDNEKVPYLNLEYYSTHAQRVDECENFLLMARGVHTVEAETSYVKKGNYIGGLFEAAGTTFTIKSNGSALEGEDITFTVSILNPNYSAVSDYLIFYRAWDVSAEGGKDYKGIPEYQGLHFTKYGQQSYQFSVETYADTKTDEGSETFDIRLYDFSKAYLDVYARGTIRDAPPTSFSITPNASATEGEDMSFTIAIVNPNYALNSDYLIYYRAWDGSAEGGTDYEGIPTYQALHFTKNGDQSHSVTVETYVDGDSTEGDETFDIRLYDNTKAYLYVYGQGTIHDAPPTTFTITDAETAEGGDLNFTITIVNPNYALQSQYLIYYRASDGAALGGEDYEGIPTDQPVYFTKGGGQSFTFSVKSYADDNGAEGDETFDINLYDNTHTSLGASGKGTIHDVVLINHDPTVTAHDKSVASGTVIPLSELFSYSDTDAGDSVTGFAVQDSSAGGGHLYRDGVQKSDNVVYGNSLTGIPISELGRWTYVAGAAGSVDTIRFTAIDSHNAYNHVAAIANVSAIGSHGVSQSGIDYRHTSAESAIPAADIRAAGYQFVMAYIGNHEGMGYLRSAEVADLVAQGLSIVSIYETDPTSITYFTSGKGREDAQAAWNAAQKAGQPFGTAIYFTVDFDPGGGSANLSKIVTYFREINAFLGSLGASNSFKIGVYGSGAVCTAVMNDNLCGASFSWLAGSPKWTGTPNYTDWTIRQHDNGVTHIDGIAVDLDATSGLVFGAWGSNATPPIDDDNHAPSIFGPAEISRNVNEQFAFTDLISGSDPDGSVSQYRFSDSHPGTGHLTLDGAALDGESVTVSASELYRVGYDTGSVAGSNTIAITARDDQGLSSDSYLQMTIKIVAANVDPDNAGETRATALDLGSISAGSHGLSGSVGAGDLADYFRFKVEESGDIEVSLSALVADADLYLLDPAGHILQQSRSPGSLTEAVSHHLKTGSYYLAVERHSGDTQYQLGFNFKPGGQASPDPNVRAVIPLPYGPQDYQFQITQGYGGATSHTSYLYYSLDFALNHNTSVLSVGTGEVVFVRNDIDEGDDPDDPSNIGNFVTIRFYDPAHPDDVNHTFYASYFHLQKGSITVEQYDKVVLGTIIGQVGRTGGDGKIGYHLHFQTGRTTVPFQSGKVADASESALGPAVWFEGTADGALYVGMAPESDTVPTLVGQHVVVADRSYSMSPDDHDLTLLGSDNANVVGNNLNNIIFGNDGANRIDASEGNDRVFAGSGDDLIVGGNFGGDDAYDGGEGVDTLTYNKVLSRLNINLGKGLAIGDGIGRNLISGIENVVAGQGSDTLTGDLGDNLLDGSAGDDNLRGEDGNDWLVGGTGNDTLQGGEGSDGVDYSDATDAVSASLLTGEANGATIGVDSLNGIENLTGGSGDDVLTGNAKANRLLGGDGDDVLVGGEGNDMLDGGKGLDTMSGGGGDDTYYVDNAGDVVSEEASLGADAGGNDNVISRVSYVLPAYIETLSLVGDRNSEGTGNGGANIIFGNSGHNRLDGGGGADRLYGLGGNDTYVVDDVNDRVSELLDGADAGGIDTIISSVSFTLSAFVEKLTLTGEDAINGIGNDLNNTLVGNAGNNALDGRGSADSLAGAAGDDTYFVDNPGDRVNELLAEDGTDTVRASVDFTLRDFVENLVLAGAGNLTGIGNGADNSLGGNAGNNLLDGRGGADAMSGGAGDDTYVVDHAGDTVTEASAAGGTDLVRAYVSFTLGRNVENLVLAGTAAIDGTGNSLDNTILGNGKANSLSGGAGHDSLTGGDGGDTLDGGSGADAMSGGRGNDTYHVDNAGDVVSEEAIAGTDDGGVDTVISLIDYVLGNFVENLTLGGDGLVDGTGNDLRNTILGNERGNALSGGGQADELRGNGGADLLDGGSGADRLFGGAGNDTYRVDSAGDAVSEETMSGTDDGGSDTVVSLVSYQLGMFVENLTLDGEASIGGTGNGSDNRIVGNGGNNRIDGGAGSDRMYGGAGNDSYYFDDAGDRAYEDEGDGIDRVVSSVDVILSSNIENLILIGDGDVDGTGNGLGNVLTGNSGNNRLDGKAGADRMSGGGGNDIYYADNAGDRVSEGADGGIDRVYAAVGFVLGDNVEQLALTGAADINGTGNGLDNVLTGNSGGNRLDGRGGADRMTGGAGDDTYLVDSSGDRVVETSAEGGSDTVRASVSYALGNFVENLTLAGSEAINAKGNALNNILIGNSAQNLLVGGAGQDVLTGGLGADTFIFGRGSGADTITDFRTSQDDRIDLRAFDGLLTSVSIVQSGSNVVIDLGDGDVITLLNVQNNASLMSHIIW